jgi:hypothetical protein
MVAVGVRVGSGCQERGTVGDDVRVGATVSVAVGVGEYSVPVGVSVGEGRKVAVCDALREEAVSRSLPAARSKLA